MYFFDFKFYILNPWEVLSYNRLRLLTAAIFRHRFSFPPAGEVICIGHHKTKEPGDGYAPPNAGHPDSAAQPVRTWNTYNP